MKISRIFIICVLLLLGLSRNMVYPQEDVLVRVAVIKDITELEVSMKGRYRIVDGVKGHVLSEGRTLKHFMIKASEQGIQINEQTYPTQSVKIIPHKEIIIYSEKGHRRYRGTLHIVLTDNKTLLVINQIELERYIKGVLYREVSNKWPMQATLAQAVASRSYALYRTKVRKDQLYDVTDTSQAYGGRSAERYRTSLAVKRTKGEVLAFEGTVLPAYFHTNSGGHTEDVSELWNHDLKPLKGVVDPYVADTRHYHWKRNVRLKDIQDRLNAHGYALDLIKVIKVIDRSQSGRVRTLEIITRKGKIITISAKDFRRIVGPHKIIKSNMYTITMKGYFCDFEGRGFGHGVGMSQWGAYTMASQRVRYKDILQYYYPGTNIVLIRDLKDTPGK